MIKIQGLTRRQRALADVLWKLEDWESVETFLSGLHSDTRKDAELVVQLMELSAIDKIMDVDLAVKVLDRFSL
jgi:hypothetical protein